MTGTLRLRPSRMGLGFTLLEVAITLAMMGIVSAAAVSALAALQRSARGIGNGAMLEESLRSGLLFVADEARDAGGVGIPPWASVLVEDNCAARGAFPDCRGSDRVTLIQAIPSYPGCQVSEDLGSGRVRFQKVDDGRRRNERCCFNQGGFVRQIALVQPQIVRPFVALGEGSDCIFRLVPIVPDEALPVGPPASMTDAVAVLADVKTFYIDWSATKPDRGTLNMHVELNGDASLTGERLTILEDIGDFQVALGYDLGGRGPLESTTGAGDAWWPNGPGETGRPDRRAFPAPRAALIGISAIVMSGGVNASVVATPWGAERRFERATTRVGTERVRLGVAP